MANMPRQYGCSAALSAACVWILLSSVASAQIPFYPVRSGSTYNPLGSGARALGQGNAFIAVADDATAANWNPSGLTQLERPELSLALEGTRRELDTKGQEGGEISLADLNYASAVLPITVWGRHAVVSLNYLKQNDFSWEMTRSGAFRDATGFPIVTEVDKFEYFDTSGSLYTLSPAAAFDLTPKLALGLALNIWNHGITGASQVETRRYAYSTTRFTLWGAPMGVPIVNESNGVDEFEVNHGYSLTLGAMYRLSREWTLGLMVKPPATLHLDMKRRYIRVGAVNDYGKVGSELELPLTVGLGAAWRPDDAFTWSADLTWTQWSEFILVTSHQEHDPVTANPLRITTVETEDTWTFRTGVEYLLIFDEVVVPLRAGFAYDPAPAPGELDEFYSVTLGTGVKWGNILLDIAYEYRWAKSVQEYLYVGFPDADGDDIESHRILASMILHF